jgi:RNA polymerase sigma-70 factor (ECF subfamily)
VRVVAVVCGDRQRAEDAVQEALVDVWTKRKRVDNVARWVTTAAVNRARSRWRSLSAERRAFLRLAARTPERHEQQPSSFDARLAEALASLPRAQREAVALHYLLDLSIADIGAYLGVAGGTVKTHLHRGRAALRTALEDAAGQEDESNVGT